MKSLEKKKRITKKFIPKKSSAVRVIISEHAILRYKQRFNIPNGNSKKALKSIMKKGSVALYYDRNNMVIEKDNTFLIITEGELKTVYTKEMFNDSIERIKKTWREKDDIKYV